MSPRSGAALIACAITTLGGCSSRQLYGTGQGWQRNDCQKVVDTQERSRCLSSASTSYEEYRRQTEAAKSAPRPDASR